MMMLGIVLHAAMLYVADPPPAFAVPLERNTSYAFDLVFSFIHCFRMPLFFLLAGFFAALLVERRGVAGTLKNRAARVLAPLAAAIITILPVTMILWVDIMLANRFAVHALLPDAKLLEALQSEMASKGMPAGQLPLGHLWFLYYLCYFYLLLAPCRWLAQWTQRHELAVRRAISSPWLLLGLSLYTAAMLWPFRGGQLYEGFGYFRPHLPSLAYYGSFFVLGYLFHAHREAVPGALRHLRLSGIAAIALFAAATWASRVDNSALGSDTAAHLVAVLLNGLCTWALIYFFVSLTLRYFDRGTRWVVYTSQASYWVFLIHMPLAMLAGWWLVQFDLPAGVKFLLVCALATLGSFVTFHYGVQRSWLGRFLHGKRFDLDWPWRGNRALTPVLKAEEVGARGVVEPVDRRVGPGLEEDPEAARK